MVMKTSNNFNFPVMLLQDHHNKKNLDNAEDILILVQDIHRIKKGLSQIWKKDRFRCCNRINLAAKSI